MEAGSSGTSSVYIGGHYCCVTGCHFRRGRDNVKFYSFPRKNPEQFNLWVNAVKRENFKPNKNTVICSAHFVSGQPANRRDSPDYIPTCFPTHHRKAKTEADLARFERAKKRRPNEEKVETKNDEIERVSQEQPEEINVEEVSADIEFEVDDNDCQIWDDKATQTPHVSVKNIGIETDPVEARAYEDRVLANDEVCRTVCGVALSFFNMTMEQLDEALSKSRALSKKGQLVLYFMKLKQSLDFTVLATIFGCNEKTVSVIFGTVLDAHFAIASRLTWWLPRDKVKATMPGSFKLHYPECRAIIDASEVKITCPSTVLARNLSYSHYKGNFTAKFLVAIAPSGFIMLISKAYGGRMTDTQLTNESGLLDLLEPGDQILADKGFPSIEEDVLNRGAFLVMPTFTSGGRQFSAQENKHSYKVASVRIHVERAIQRLKTFKILNFVEKPMFRHLDKILIVIGYCVNHFGPLIKEK